MMAPPDLPLGGAMALMAPPPRDRHWYASPSPQLFYHSFVIILMAIFSGIPNTYVSYWLLAIEC